MTITGFLLRGLPRWRRAAERMGTGILLAGLSVMAVHFYLQACHSLAQLQQIGPDQLVRSFSGI